MGDFKDSVTAAAINLADDAPWKKIQKNTFTRWCNEHLRSVELQISDLKFDLSDGLVLISLLEVLSHKRMFRKYHTRPTFRQLKLDNVSVALEFLDHEKVKLVSIDSKAIVDGNLKLILGLIWTLIQHYSISTPVWEDEANDSVSKLTPEMRLLGWIQNKVPELPITNFSHDWQDGKALGALVDGLAPGLCPDWESWDTVHRVSNTKEAMQQADDWLGIPQLIAPEEILDPAVDEQSVMTYLSLFPKARLKPGAPLKPKKVPKPKACCATGRGLQSKGMRVGQLAEFKVDTCKAGPGNLEVLIRDPSGKAVSVRQKDALEGVYSFEYTPTAKGDHTVDITWTGQHIAKSPYKVHVGSEAGPQKIRAWGPGLEGGTVGLSADFLVESLGVDSGMLGFAIEGPSQAKITCDDHNDGSCIVRFWPTEAGEYAVHVMCDDEEIQDSPFMASIRLKRKDFHPEKVKVEGPGVSQTGCIVNLQTQFTVDTKQAGEGELKVCAQRADGECVNVSVASEQSGVFVCSYIPSSLSKHTITVAWGGVMVPGSPFIVTPCRIKMTLCSPVWFKPDGSEMYYSDEEMDLDEDFPDNVWPGGHGELIMKIISPSNVPSDATKVRAHGPGLKEGVLGEQAEFIIDTSRAGSGRLAIRVEGPCKVTLKCLDNQDGTCTVFYLPTEHGMYKINVLFDNSHITGSPFEAVIQKPIDPSKILVTGPGLLQGKVGEPCIVNIDCAMAGSGDLSVQAVSDSGVIVPTVVKENEDGTYTAVYVPLTGGVYTLLLKYGGKVVPNFPAKVVVDPKVYKSHVKVSRQGGIVVGERETDTCQVVADGLGLQKGLAGHPNVFSVNARSSVDDLGITVEGASECQVTCKDNGEGLYNVEYTPSVPGEYKITITCGDKNIPGSPFIASVEDVSNTADSGLCMHTGICLSTNTVTPHEIKYNGDGIYTASQAPSMEDRESLIDSPYGSSSPIPLPNWDCDRELPLAHGENMAEIIFPGFKGRICGRTSQTFTIGCSSNGEAPKTVAVVRPDGSMELLELKKSGDGTYSVVYLPTMDGCHLLAVKFSSEETFNRQFTFQVLQIDDTAQVNVAGPGLTSGMCAQHPQTFTVDSTSTKKVPEFVAIMTPDGLTEICEVRDNGDWTCTVNYTPSMEGLHSLMLKYTEDASFCSPFKFRVLPIPDSDYKHHGGQGLRKGTPAFGLDLESQLCVNTPQTFTIDGSSTGQPPETVAVVTPDGKIMLLSAKDNGDGTYLVAYSPSVEGSHSIMVKYTNDDDSFRSPIRFHAIPSHSGRRDKDVLNKEEHSSQEGSVHSNAKAPQTSANGYSVAPETDTIVKANGSFKPSTDVMGNRDRTCKMTCAPNMENSVMDKYTSEETLRSLSEFQADLTVENTEPKICTQIPQSFRINCSKSGKPPECALVITPNGKAELTEVKENPDGSYSVKYSPAIDGLHSLMVKYADDDSYCNPLRFHVLPHSASDDEHGINTTEVCSRQLKEDVCAQIPQTFTACCNTNEALETDMSKPDGTRDLVGVLNNENRTYGATHTPSAEDAHSSADRNPSEEDFQSHQPSSSQASNDHIGFQNKAEGRNVIPLGAINQAGFISCDIVLPSDLSEGEITGEVITPSRKTTQPDVTDNKDGTIIIKFDPSEEGLHQLLIKSTGNDPPVLPLQYYANSLANRSTMAYGRGLVYGIANETATFTICQEDSALNDLDITIEGPSEADVRCLDNADGTCTVSYLPTEPGDYEIQVQHNDMPIRGSPFNAKVTDGNIRRSQVKLGSAVDFTINITEEDISQLSASIISPTGNDVPCLLKTQPDSHLGVSFIPREAGEHLVSIMKDGEHVGNSPISLSISQAEIGDSSKVKAFGPGLHTGHTFCMSEFVVDTWDAGYGGLTVVIEGPSKVDVYTEEMEHGTCNISYHPIKAGTYKISIKFSDEHIPGSPFTAVITDRGFMRENITHKQKAAPIASIGSECSLFFKIPGTDAETLSAHIYEPSGTQGEAVIVATGSDTYTVSFLAKEMGVYNVTIKNQGQTIPGCPLQYTVGPLGQGGCERIQVWGQGLQTALANVPADFNIWSREAGAGTLSVSVEGPGKIELHFDDRLDGSCIVSYTAQEPGDYEVSVMFNEEHISESPFLVSVSGATDNSLTQGQSCSDHNQMCNRYEEPSQSELEINISSDSSAEPVFLSNASKVICHGPGLSKGILGRKNTFYVDCSKAGQNLLFVGMHGPTVPCERLTIIHMGGHQYRINYAVKERGKYTLAVKWGDEHIPGSPFHIRVL
ncbi:filamin-B isoform X2 [Chanodichthys erythropterus]|uniref:filamin-B isoform X2 n=1 Tax=Chanodichthys erythropterus TaxID=933992 RepID=UPI00351F143A